MIKYISMFWLVFRCFLVPKKENLTGFSTGLTGRSKNLDPTGNPTGVGRPDWFPSLSCSINIVNTGAIVLIYHIVFVIRVYASNVNRGPDLQSADPLVNGEESTIELQFSYSRKYDLKKKKKKQKKRSRE